MRRKIFTSGLICLFVVFLIYCKKGTPTTPELPKPQATYAGVLIVGGVYADLLGLITFDYAYTVTNTNNVGATIDRVVHKLFYQGSVCNEETWYPTSTERIEANGSYSWEFLKSYAYTGFLPAKAKVIIYVNDDNGHSVTITGDPVTIIWLYL